MMTLRQGHSYLWYLLARTIHCSSQNKATLHSIQGTALVNLEKKIHFRKTFLGGIDLIPLL